jgi:succinate dehydrogenase / fumarate reductase membrane anchor subunit
MIAPMPMPTGTGPHAKPGGGFELWSWYFMRVSGVVLLLIAVFHLLWMHLKIGLNNITFETIVERWAGPLGPFWRVYDLALLAFALTHGMNGARWLINDYIHRRGWNMTLKSILGVLYALLILMGAYVILTFSAPPEALP